MPQGQKGTSDGYPWRYPDTRQDSKENVASAPKSESSGAYPPADNSEELNGVLRMIQ
ncbi:hypothetical protein PGT21_020603 [Puccinia graminis f. sp. tritici]|uniref:Uncharacterized protein n=1 Tax=Puccinia graminis f. sp. tritici TaxID=56615 RepID=A0A5B0MLE8_PUCGR|nr:hypothetical protein PGT21_020603 [Puccinia graminis f. sp. tritici]KAA1126984.1 hypothetical protein PGTUg99_034934 [Puccinia graminis f. sp. tritici]